VAVLTHADMYVSLKENVLSSNDHTTVVLKLIKVKRQNQRRHNSETETHLHTFCISDMSEQ